MILLDTDTLSALKYVDSPRAQRLQARFDASGEILAASIISFEEQVRGWLSKIAACKSIDDQVTQYLRLQELIPFFDSFEMLPFNEASATHFKELRKQKIRLGTMDLKIASIALAFDLLLLSANLSDFRKVPHLRVEDWTV